MVNARPLALALAGALAACNPVPSSSPGEPATGSLGPTAAVTTSPSAQASIAAAEDIDALLDAMEAAVVTGNRDAYLSLVDTSDPVFRTEHTRWVDDWAGPNPVDAYAIELEGLEVVGDVATGTLTVTWRHGGELEPRAATYIGSFARRQTGWRYTGEAWTSTEVPHFVIRVAPGLESATPDIAAELPHIYEGVTGALDHLPAADLEIKVYNDPPALVANTLLSLPDIDGWNEPGESLKLQLGTGRDLPPVIAHELAHFVIFDRAGTKRSRMPWWLDEGVATLVGTGLDEDNGNAARLARVIDCEAEDGLAAWKEMTIFEETPLELWDHVYAQGYEMALFVTQEFGKRRRNAWLAAMATEMDIEAATPAQLGLTFDELDARFRAWLAGQR